MLGRAQNGETLTISKIVVGSGSASQASDLWPLTALIHFEMNVVINTKNDDGNGQLLVEGVFRSDTAPHAFDLHEVGIMAHIGTESDRLYSVANAFLDPVDHIDPAAPTFYGYKIKLIIDRIPAASLVIQIGPTDAVLGENVGTDATGPGPYKEAIGNLLRFKRFVEGVGIDLTEDALHNTITIAQKQLTQNVDLYVPATYPGITDPTVLFPTIQAAHDYLLAFHIPSDKTATIHVYSGHFTQTVPINFTHPDAEQIQVIGLDVVEKTMRPATNITRSGTLPDIDVVIPVASTTGIAVNDVCYLYDAPTAQLEGCGYITVVGGTSVTMRMKIYNVLPPASIACLSTTKLLVFPTQFSTNTTTVFNCPNGIKLIKNFGLRASVGAQLGTAFSIFGPYGGFENVVAVNYAIGFGIAAAACYLTPVVAANACGAAMEVGPSGTVLLNAPSPVSGYARFTWNGNVTYGLWVVGGSYVTGAGGSTTYACSNGNTGIRSDTRGFVGVGNTGSSAGGYVIGWNQFGAQAVMVGIVLASIDVMSAIALNTVYDLQSKQGGQIHIVHNSIITGTYDPALGALGSSGGFISMSL